MQSEKNLDRNLLSIEAFVHRSEPEAREDDNLESLLGFRRSVDFHRLSFEERCRVLEKINGLMRTCLVAEAEL